MSKLIDRDVLAARVAQYKQEGTPVVLLGGTFNPVRPYQRAVVAGARQYAGDNGSLIVGINSDSSLRLYRGGNGQNVVSLPTKEELLRFVCSASFSPDYSDFYGSLKRRLFAGHDEEGGLYYLFPAEQRAAELSSFPEVDHVVVFSEPDVVHTLSVLVPDVFCKGSDYTLDTMNQDERSKCMELGIEIKFVGMVGRKEDDIDRFVSDYFREQLEERFV